MLTRQKTLLITVLCFAIASLAVAAASAATVTVSVATKSAKSDIKTLDPKAVRVIGDQVGVYIENTLLTPQQLEIKFDGVKDQDYDVYINGASSGVKSGQALREGIDRTIPGAIADPVAMHCLKALQPKVAPVYKSVHAREGAQPWRAAYTLGQAKEWVESGIRSDEKYRSVEVILVKAGNSMTRMPFASRLDAKASAKAVLKSCDLLHAARANMYNVLTDAKLRNEVVGALTPVSMSASCSMKNGKPTVTAVIVNDSDLPVTGNISLSDIKGWKTVGGKLDIGIVKPGKSYSTSFGLASSAKNCPTSKSVPLTAVVELTKRKSVAKLWLFADPTCGSR